MDSEDAARQWLIDSVGADQAAMERLDQLARLLAQENERQNLVAQSSLPHIWRRHVADSAQLLMLARAMRPGDCESAWLDLGTGAGFPGLVIAALQPERAITLVDSRRLRVEWLTAAATALNLKNVRVKLSRVEDLPQVVFSVISARAFAPLERLLTVSARFSTPQTLWLLPKGAKARHEVAELGPDWRHMFHVEQSLTDPAGGIVVGELFGQPGSKGTPR